MEKLEIGNQVNTGKLFEELCSMPSTQESARFLIIFTLNRCNEPKGEKLGKWFF
jgi:hypothetical protein